MEKNIELKEKVALITGAGGGIGRALALQLAAHGANLCLVGRNKDKLEALAADIKNGVKVVIFQIDLTQSDGVARLQEELRHTFDRVDILVHSMGTISLGSIESASMEDFDRQMKTNFRAPYELTRMLLPWLFRSRGEVVFINSSAGIQVGRAGLGQYGAIKHALKVVADSLRDEVNDRGVRVLSIYPGRTATPMQLHVQQEEGKIYHPEKLLQPDDIATIVVSALTLPRTAEVTEIHIRPMCKN